VPDYTIEAIESAPFAQLCYVAWLAGQSNALVVDPGFDTRSVIRLLEQERLRPAAILNTHGHVDHIAGNSPMKLAFPEAPLIIGRHETPLLSDPEANMSAPFGLPVRSPEADRLVDDGDRIELAGFQFLVREIPGHSPGSVVYITEQFDPPIVFGGDVLFAGSVGRTDFGGDFPLLRSGIRSKLFALPDATRIYPGHGPSTTIGAERRSNPYVGDDAGSLNPS
jgi:glyoxylase-like metal-dependent hydrolase (beta-lactamase superfamily II)